MSNAHGDEHHDHGAHHEDIHGNEHSHDFDEHSDQHESAHHDWHWHADDHIHSHEWDDHQSHSDTHESHEEEPDETGTLLPIGTINDILSREYSPELDIAVQFPLSNTLAVDHNPWMPLGDITADILPKINLACIPKIILRKLRTPEYKDIFKEREFQPMNSFHFFIQKYIVRKKHLENSLVPRYETITLQKPIIVDIHAIDIRNAPEEILQEMSQERKESQSQLTENTRVHGNKYSDIYLLPLPFSKKLSRYIIREKTFLLRVGSVCLTLCLLCIFSIGWSLWYAKYSLEKGISELQGLRLTLDSKIASDTINRASNHIQTARFFGKSAHVISFLGYKQGNSFLHITEWFSAISQVLMRVNTIRSDFITHEFPEYSGDYLSFWLFTNPQVKYTDFLMKHRDELTQIGKLLPYSEYHFSSIDASNLDPKTISQLEKLIVLLRESQMAIQFIQENQTVLLRLVGHEKPMKYLLLNQNKDEIRANGGFPGSAIEFELYKGRIQSHVKRDIYYYDWHLYPYAETPPPWISEITKAYGIRDANYEPDFAESFVTMNRFFEKSGWSTLDGAFGIHQWLIEKILAITWPIEVTWVTEPFTQKNFSRNMSILVETEFGKKHSPKDILFLFMDTLVNTIQIQNLYKEVFAILSAEVRAGQIVGYTRDPEGEKFLEKLQKPLLYKTSPDFVMPVFTSLSGNKSDRYIQRDFTLTSTQTGNCIKQNMLEIRSNHTFSSSEEKIIRDTFSALSIDPKKVSEELAIQWKGENKQYVRLLVPKNAVLVNSTFKKVETIRTHPEYDMFTFWIEVRTWEISKESITYSLPEESCKNTTKFAVQPGLLNFTFNLR
jgi:Protein of unknown function (DUF4012)